MIAFILAAAMLLPQSDTFVVRSPDGTIQVTVGLRGNGEPYYAVRLRQHVVLDPSALGLVRDDGDFTKGLSLSGVGSPFVFSDRYPMRIGKRASCTYKAVRRVFHFRNADGQAMDLVFQISNEAVAFRYMFPGSTPRPILEEHTTFQFDTATRTWLQPMSDPKTGWSQVNPCYEEYYDKDQPAGRPSPLASGWVFPALFRRGDVWVLLTEAGEDGSYCGGRLQAASPGGAYRMGFPGPLEVFPGGPSGPVAVQTPWRIICLGSLGTIVESTAGTDLAPAQVAGDFHFARPGKASWSWPLLKDDSITYSVQKRFIDYAAEMHWQYTLIDVNWDKTIGIDSIRSLVRYARDKHVGIWLWYNSSGDWNSTPYHPKSQLLTHDARDSIFGALETMGVAGVKIDFFGGDGSSMMQYYLDIFKDAAAHHLMVNVHGATLPRGWERTYPNLMSAEAVKGFEYLTFEQKNADEEAAHCATLPFTRNAFDPMDFTPMCLDSIPRIQRRTTPGFELALSVLFLSGVQHFAEIPKGMATVPAFVKTFLQDLPLQWDDTRFIGGYPGQWIVLARRAGKHWYICGINAGNENRRITLAVASLQGRKGFLIKDGATGFSRRNLSLPDAIILPPRGGFVAVVQ